jgi:hypothetical protein
VQIPSVDRWHCFAWVLYRIGQRDMNQQEAPYHYELPFDDYRRTRELLRPDDFAVSDHDTPPDPGELVLNRVWRNIVHLSDDVALRTTTWQGSLTSRMHELLYQWLVLYPQDLDGLPYGQPAHYSAYEEFDAVSFIAVHGWYRQALGCLRNALELLTHAAAFASDGDAATFMRWERGQHEVRFGLSLRRLRNSSWGRSVDAAVAPLSIFGTHDQRGWVASFYRRLCGYAHSQAGSSNSDFWHSNGPVYVPRAYTLVYEEFREALGIGYLLMKCCWSEFKLPDDLTELLAEPTMSGWPQFAKDAFAACF